MEDPLSLIYDETAEGELKRIIKLLNPTIYLYMNDILKVRTIPDLRTVPRSIQFKDKLGDWNPWLVLYREVTDLIPYIGLNSYTFRVEFLFKTSSITSAKSSMNTTVIYDNITEEQFLAIIQAYTITFPS